ncbi:hypothetical protein, partial [Vibrio vulnificus]|uniref:hypothetical protein n=1 Tax=Vibrio vulnificus TaxID=672 RepID=UPI00187D521F
WLNADAPKDTDAIEVQLKPLGVKTKIRDIRLIMDSLRTLDLLKKKLLTNFTHLGNITIYIELHLSLLSPTNAALRGAGTQYKSYRTAP